MRILIVEDNELLANGMMMTLCEQGYAVDVIHDGLQATYALKQQEYDLILLDLGLPKQDGLSVLRTLRAKKLNTPVIIISARDKLDQRITGLDQGADDYLCKPFELDEIVARVRALLRRSNRLTQNQISYGDIQIDLSDRSVNVNGEQIILHRRELSVLEYLILNTGKVVSKSQIADRIASLDEELTSTAIETYISRLRKRFGSSLSLSTIRGLGYLLEPMAKHD
ncbi:MAG: response regulator transcription factor [Aliivibrio sp.]|uniref:response regulator n=1 Tax=Aliivibrio sp. TaxID=1872443 RepID=UPI001A5836AF|nr:response regulator transcription factor [Aliivibrio sp.]